MPQLSQAWSRALGSLDLLAEGVYERVPNAAAHLVANQAINDFIEMGQDLLTGRGRSALRVSRSLFEQLVTLREVCRDPALAQRYEDHRHVGLHLEARARLGVERLPEPDRSAARRSAERTLRRTRRRYEQMLTRYQQGFRRSWHPRNLADRAAAQGLSSTTTASTGSLPWSCTPPRAGWSAPTPAPPP
ncbi:MAG: hypothetical protein M3P96_10920 [Actinomycetota bacterium]|nr:hypothetical protein [Actinomycetota bacterium]